MEEEDDEEGEEEEEEEEEEELLGDDGVDDSLSGPSGDGSVPTPESLEDSGTDPINGSHGACGGRCGAPGGPLAVPGFVSGRINVRDFQESCSSLLSVSYPSSRYFEILMICSAF